VALDLDRYLAGNTIPYYFRALYAGRRLASLPHRRRIARLLRELDGLLTPQTSLADVGTGDSLLTALIAARYGLGQVEGLDRQVALLEIARAHHPGIRYREYDLNRPTPPPGRYDVVLCLETLEHVGDLEAAIDNLLGLPRPGGHLLLSVPIEIGLPGLLKFAVRLRPGGIGFQDLPRTRGLAWRYLLALLTGRRLARFRQPRAHWETHFGFDHRVLEALLAQRGLAPQRFDVASTRFYRLTLSGTAAASANGSSA